ncbi:MAG: class I SAM-dependent methyltransferase [Clostridia bacterium]|nr:class I SAM-dependent methyltransferase [Clostridia bacterium]
MNTWDYLIKQMLWKQLDFVQGMKVLDFGSGAGETAAHLAARNDVTAVEPWDEMLSQRIVGNYTQLQGGIELVHAMEDASFDLVLCHNVLEYVDEKEAYLRELARVVKPGGLLSLVKHNRPGRVMQMAVLLNDFDMANTLLSGGNGTTSKFGDIRYYTDEDALRALPDMELQNLWGARTFWDLQQKQECHTDPEWQEKMLALEHRVSTVPEYQAIAFFHHLLLRKRG